MRPGTPTTRAGQITEQLALFELHGLDALIQSTRDSLGKISFGERARPEWSIQRILLASLIEARAKLVDRVIPDLAKIEAARLGAEEADELADAEAAA